MKIGIYFKANPDLFNKKKVNVKMILNERLLGKNCLGMVRNTHGLINVLKVSDLSVFSYDDSFVGAQLKGFNSVHSFTSKHGYRLYFCGKLYFFTK